MDGIAQAEGYGIRIYTPGERALTSGGLTWRDVADLMELAEVMIIARNDLSNEAKGAKLIYVQNARAILHYRFETGCDHERWGCPFWMKF